MTLHKKSGHKQSGNTLTVRCVVVAMLLSACGGHNSTHSTTTATPFTGPIVIPTAPTTTATSAPVAADIRRRMGFNLEDVTSPANANSWRDPSFLAQLASLHPGVLRFGGTTTMWIDWSTGQFVDVPDLPRAFRANRSRRKGLTMADYANVLQRTGAEAVFDLNMATSSLDHEFDMLRTARSLGIKVRRIELGNEIYDPAYSRYSRLYPTGRDYARVANDWMRAIKQEFPDAEFGVSLWDDANPITPQLPARVRDWNREVLSDVHGEQALIFHPYWRVSATDVSVTGSDSQALLRAAAEQWERVAQTDLTLLPPGVQAWLTEWNVSYARGQDVNTTPQTWAHALAVAWFAVASATDPRVGLSLTHDVLSSGARASISNGSNSSTLYGITSQGAVLAAVFDALDQLGPATRINIANEPSTPAVAGSGAGTNGSTIVVNPAAVAVTVAFANHAASSCTVHVVAADPSATVDGAAVDFQATRTTIGNCSTINVEPFSITVID